AVVGSVALGALVAAVGGGARLATTLGRRAEAEDTAQLAIEAFTFDVRRAGYDPRGIGVQPLAAADAPGGTLPAGLAGAGAVDAGSEEVPTWICNGAARRLSRVIGAQSLPIADAVAACAFRYLAADGQPLAAPPGGLAPADLARVRAIALDVTVAPPGL